MHTIYVPTAYCMKPVSLNVYINQKIDMLTKDFCIQLSEDEIDHFWKLKTEEDVDNFAHYLFMERL